jgi:hypothetical protein
VIDVISIRRLVVLTALVIALPTCGGCASTTQEHASSENLRTTTDEWDRPWMPNLPEHIVPERVDGGIMP